MAKSDVQDFVCRPFCSFFREGEKEELICNGALSLERLVAEGMLSPEEVTAMNLKPIPDSWQNPPLEEAVCGKCPFRAEDCDFRAESPPPDAKPCGGYILLALLAGRGSLSMERLKEMADG